MSNGYTEVKIDEELDKHLQLLAKNANLKDAKFHVVEASEKGDNFAGVVYRVEAEGVKDGKPKKIHSILKIAPPDNFRRELLKSAVIFNREIYFYQEVLPVFSELLEDYGLKLEHFPTLYASNKNHGEEMLIMEDLSNRGYKMKNGKMLDLEHALMSIKYLAEFHAYSFAAREKRPEVFEKFSKMEEPIFVPRIPPKDAPPAPNRAEIFSGIIMKALSDESPHYAERFKKFSDKLYENMIRVTHDKTFEPYAVVNHGDCWTNNMLFKYNEDSSKPEDLCFIDFQLSRYGSPAFDISYMVFCCVPYDIRQKHYDELLRAYHDSLSQCLTKLDCDVLKLFPYETLIEHMHRYSKLGGGMAVFVLHLFTDSENRVTEIAEIEDLDALYNRLETDEYYRDTLKHTFKELIDRDFI